jgi:glucose-1-phosphate thymidylyltransferase
MSQAVKKGIILAGGTGSRLYPLTVAISKQLVPVYDKPLLYYPLATLMQAGIRDILVITAPDHNAQFRELLGDGSAWGLSIDYVIQDAPNGIAEALVLGEDFLEGAGCCLILGDNIFYGASLQERLRRAATRTEGATVFGYWVSDPRRYGVAEMDPDGNVLSLQEKPAQPRSNYAVTGIYFYDGRAPAMARALEPSPRGELEITDLNAVYLAQGDLRMEVFDRGTAWLDAGTPESLAQASNFIEAIEQRQGLKIACPEEIAFEQGWIDAAMLARHADRNKSSYCDYLRALLDRRAGGTSLRAAPGA